MQLEDATSLICIQKSPHLGNRMAVPEGNTSAVPEGNTSVVDMQHYVPQLCLMCQLGLVHHLVD
jgi:hypothetical protein